MNRGKLHHFYIFMKTCGLTAAGNEYESAYYDQS